MVSQKSNLKYLPWAFGGRQPFNHCATSQKSPPVLFIVALQCQRCLIETLLRAVDHFAGRLAFEHCVSKNLGLNRVLALIGIIRIESLPVFVPPTFGCFHSLGPRYSS